MARTTTRPQAPGEEQTAWWADPPVVDPERLKAFVARVDAHPWVLNLIIAMSPMIVGLLALLAHGRALRYTESAFAAAGWDGLTLPVDQAGSVARAVLGGTLIASIVGGAMLAYFAAKDGVQRGGSAVAPILITAVPMMWGASQALGDNGQPIGYTLMVGAGLVFVFAVAGLATGLVKRFRPQRVRAGRGEPPRRQGLAGATLVVLTPAIALTAFLAEADRSAHNAVAALRSGASQPDLDRLLSPLPFRLVRLSWNQHAASAVHEHAPEDMVFLLLGRIEGHTYLVEASPPRDRPPVQIDVRDDEVTLKPVAKRRT